MQTNLKDKMAANKSTDVEQLAQTVLQRLQKQVKYNKSCIRLILFLFSLKKDLDLDFI